MRPEFDLVDQHKVHYDGILKLPGICTLRSLTYLPGTPATLVALTSHHNYTTLPGTSIVVDFNRELHYAHLTTTKSFQEPRVMIKAAIHLVDAETHPMITFLHIVAHRIIFFAIKSVRNAFESSTSGNPSTKLGVMALDNVMRSLNKIHMALPLLVIGLPLGAVLIAPFWFPLQFLPYLIHIVVVCFWNIESDRAMYMRFLAILIAFGRMFSGAKTHPNTTNKVLQIPTASIQAISIMLLALHVAWIGLCWFMERNAHMAHHILLAPIPAPIEL
jgi:hypothetical protein